MSLPFTRDGIRCLVPAPKRLTSWFLPFEPFQVTLWLGLIGCLFLEFLGLLFTRKLGDADVNEYSWKTSIQFGYISTLKLLISQGTNYLVKSTSLRIVLLSCYMIDIIITSVYCGGLASILTIPTLGEPADTKERLVKHNLVWSASSVSWIASLFNTEDELLVKIRELFQVFPTDELKKKSIAGEIGLAIERLKWGHFALNPLIDQEVVDRMKIMTEDIYFEYVVAFTPRPWALMEKFNDFILSVQSSGIFKLWEWMVVKDHLDEKLQRQIEASTSSNFADAGPVPLGLENFAGVLVIWIVGTTFSVAVFIFELICHKKLKLNEETLNYLP